MTTRAHKILLVPNKKQKQILKRQFLQTQAVKHVFLEWNKEMYAAWKEDPTNPYPSYSNILKRWTKEKPECGNLLSRPSITRAAINVDTAVRNHLKNPEHFGLPDFEKKKDVTRYSFYISNTSSYIKDGYIQIPKVGHVKLSESFRFPGAKIMSYTFSYYADQILVSISALVEKPKVCTSNSTVGVDVGLKHIAVTSDNAVLDYPESAKKASKRIKVQRRKLAAKQQGSNNYNK